MKDLIEFETKESLDSGSEIDSINDYLFLVNNWLEELQEEGISNKKLFFRGQANINWDITPSLFRDELVSKENQLIELAYNKKPSEFINFSDFEILTKLQHYGLPTRLLDVTTNPLVALYFACEETVDEIEYEDGKIERLPAAGCVYYKQSYNSSPNEDDVLIITYLAKKSLSNDYSLEMCLKELTMKGFFTEESANNCRKNNYESLISILQSNYFVESTQNNERLIRQSGAFILPACFNIIENEDNIGNSILQKAESNLRKEFNDYRIIIPNDKKEQIRQQLNYLNINEASLFPELEHQLKHIKEFQQSRREKRASMFEPFLHKKINDLEIDMADNDNFEIIQEKTLSATNKVLKKYSFRKELNILCIDSINNNITIDWYTKVSNKNKMISDLSRVLRKNNIHQPAKNTAIKIVEEICEELLK